MPTKPSHGVTLWAVPRFHRSDISPANTETGVEWMNKLKTSSYPSCQESEVKRPPSASQADQAETCH